jgi:anthranilate synthase component 1
VKPDEAGAAATWHVRPAYDDFEALASRYSSVPLTTTLVCDDMTPLGAFARLEADSDRAFLLESVVGGENVARYSFLGADPACTFEVTRESAHWIDHPGGQRRPLQIQDPLASLEAHLSGYRVPALPGLPRFTGGAVGYASYDTARYYERLPAAPADDRGLADLLFDIYESMVIFDHVHKTALVVAHANVPADADARARRFAYDRAVERIDTLLQRLRRPSHLEPVPLALPLPAAQQWISNFTPAAFCGVVERCKAYIRAGDIFQVVPSQRLLLETRADPFDIYRALRVINPSPFMFYVKSPGLVLVGASPEVMCRVEDRVVTNRPLAGTRRRGVNEAEDRRLREELLADPKERAEHVMLVDLGRNDVGRVCKPGSIQLSRLMTIENYSHVMHISSTVTGELADGNTAFDALRATLPVGTVTGAPKIRAMQIIDECEPTRRGPYAGAVGYIDFAGNMDTCIALRTLVIQPGEAGRHKAYVQVGAGVVADSVPQSEYQETLNKAQSLLTAIRAAEKRFPAAGTRAPPGRV